MPWLAAGWCARAGQALLEAARMLDPGNGDLVQALQETRRERIKHVSIGDGPVRGEKEG